MPETDIAGKILDYEDGRLSEEQTLNLFQQLIDNGMISQLQGHYGRQAAAYIKAGLLEPQTSKIRRRVRARIQRQRKRV